MSRRRHLVRSVVVDAPPEAVFAALVDWPSQGDWMLGTRVWSQGPADGIGGRIAAFTGVGRLGFLDTMEIVAWEPPRLVRVRHTGEVVRGDGVFEVLALPEGRSRFVWREELELPLGALGRAGFAVIRPAFAAGVDLSLRRFAALVEQARADSGR
ncbi:MAG: SRPBCC family protein [Candidatus Nanopelagicales bacterium]|nr:SRPBCC family protein [Candidatus Nanopelagicales bacterium]